ncbi:hypothetical protein PR048_001699 [Dryococelus australis]|uniref:Uncharacterized protein n=1 Tax=Dryococelus australis TaxID=614101 RepID=A0ABQ9II30_9NEOP|nr:hypothetical protein PR048_001699 [Dryococelus australis]
MIFENNLILIRQKKLFEKILQKFNMCNSKLSNIPMEPKLNLIPSSECKEELPYKELLGSLVYLMLGSRPNLSFAITYFVSWWFIWRVVTGQNRCSDAEYILITGDEDGIFSPGKR